MSKFVAHVVGAGGRSAGCDYTIGCNQNFVRLDASTMEEAIGEIPAEILDRWSSDRIGSIRIFEVTNEVVFDLNGFLAIQKDLAKRAAEQTELHDKRRLYEKLKKEFEYDDGNNDHLIGG